MEFLSLTPRTAQQYKQTWRWFIRQYGNDSDLTCTKPIQLFIDAHLNMSDQRYRPFSRPNGITVLLFATVHPLKFHIMSVRKQPLLFGLCNASSTSIFNRDQRDRPSHYPVVGGGSRYQKKLPERMHCWMGWTCPGIHICPEPFDSKCNKAPFGPTRSWNTLPFLMAID